MNRILQRINEMLGRTGGHKWKTIDPHKYYGELKEMFGDQFDEEQWIEDMDIPKYECVNCGITRYLTRKVFPKSHCALMQVKFVHNS